MAEIRRFSQYCTGCRKQFKEKPPLAHEKSPMQRNSLWRGPLDGLGVADLFGLNLAVLADLGDALADSRNLLVQVLD